MTATARSDDSLREWFAVQVRAGKEHLCAKHASARGYDVFLPCTQERRRWSDRWKTVEIALFPGYLFCRCKGDALGKIITTPGVMRIVGDGRLPLPVPDEQIAAVQRIVHTRAAATPWPYVLTGQRVVVERGPLRGIAGVVTSVKNVERLIVSLPLLQRSVAVELHPDWIRPSASSRLALNAEAALGA
jgi:transcription antitermination factor NusG